jgi:excisionase family DNA binding protein
VPSYLTTMDIAKALKISSATVRRWADSGLLPSERTPGGHRRFSLAVAERLVHQKGGVELGFDEWIRILVSPGAALAVDAALLEERSQRMSWHAVADAIGGVLVELGVRWRHGRLNVVDVNVASERLSRALSRATDALPARAGAPTALLATVENESHTLGLRLVELCMRDWGWKTVWIGRDLPTELLAGGVEASGAAVLAMSASVARDTSELSMVVEALSVTCERARMELVVGGAGPWPDRIPHGAVVRGFRELREWMADIDARRRECAPQGSPLGGSSPSGVTPDPAKGS